MRVCNFEHSFDSLSGGLVTSLSLSKYEAYEFYRLVTEFDLVQVYLHSSILEPLKISSNMVRWMSHVLPLPLKTPLM